MKTVSVKCPDCGAALELEEGRTVYYCQYCGAKVLLDMKPIGMCMWMKLE